MAPALGRRSIRPCGGDRDRFGAVVRPPEGCSFCKFIVICASTFRLPPRPRGESFVVVVIVAIVVIVVVVVGAAVVVVSGTVAGVSLAPFSVVIDELLPLHIVAMTVGS